MAERVRRGLRLALWLLAAVLLSPGRGSVAGAVGPEPEGQLNVSYLFHPPQKALPPYNCSTHYAHHLRGVGFCSNLRAVLSDLLYASLRRRAFVVAEGPWAYGCTLRGRKHSWQCYFRPLYGCTNPVPGEPRAWENPRLWQLSARQVGFLLRVMGAEHLPAHPLWVGRALLTYLWRYTPAAAAVMASHIQQVAPVLPYIVVHIRRGDKNRARKPMAVPAIVRFVRRHARQKAVHFRSVFIMADDYHAVDEVKAIVGEEWNVLSNTRLSQVGFNACAMPTRREGSHCKHRKKADRRDNMNIRPVDGPTEAYTLLTALELARHAAYFYGDCGSNVGHVVQLLRVQEPPTAVCYDTGRPLKGYAMDV